MPTSTVFRRCAGADHGEAAGHRCPGSGTWNVLTRWPVLHQEHPAIQHPVTGQFKIGGRHVREGRLTPRWPGHQRKGHHSQPVPGRP